MDGRRKSAPLSLSLPNNLQQPTTTIVAAALSLLSHQTHPKSTAKQPGSFHGAVFDIIFAVARFCEGTFSSKYNSNFGFSFLTSWNYYRHFEFQLKFSYSRRGIRYNDTLRAFFLKMEKGGRKFPALAWGDMTS